MTLLFSIITINYNNAAGLAATVQSVLAQDCTDYEFIVIDGGSADGSMEVLQKNEQHIRYWVSEPDSGIYQAMNKGIAAAKGSYLYFLNSGDLLFAPGTLTKVSAQLHHNALVYGNLLIKEPSVEWVKYYNEPLSFEYFTRDTLPHQGSFIKRELFESIGRYDEALKIVADWKFFLEAVCIYKVPGKYIDETIAVYDRTGISAKPEFYRMIDMEKKQVLDELFPLHIAAIEELHALRKKKEFYESFEKDFFVQKYFGAKLRLRSLLKKNRK